MDISEINQFSYVFKSERLLNVIIEWVQSGVYII